MAALVEGVRRRPARPSTVRPSATTPKRPATTSPPALPASTRCARSSRTTLESGPELDNGPYGAWNRSYRQTAPLFAMSHILGATNLNISFWDFLGNRLTDEPSRAAFLKEWRPAVDWLADEFPMTLRTRGVGILWNEDIGRRVHTEAGKSWKELEVPTRAWSKWLLSAGHAVQMRPSDSVNALAGGLAWAWSDDELRGFLGKGKGLILDGPAAKVLVDRGLGDLIGLESARLVTRNDGLFSYIECVDPDFSLQAGATMPLNPADEGLRVLRGDLAKGARVISNLMTPTHKTLGPAEFLFENRLGGRVAVFPWDANFWFMMHVQRAAQLAKVLDWLDPRGTLGRVEGGPWLMPVFLTDGRTCRAAVWNACSDELSEFRVSAPKDFPRFRHAVHIDAHGNRYDAKLRAGKVALDRPLLQWECVVLT